MLPGDRIGDRFEIERLAGAGGMGEVFCARDRCTGERVAVKVLRQVDGEARFEREARILAALRHGAIVRYLSHGTTDGGRPYLVTEWLEGETLADRLARGRLSIVEALDLGARVADALGEVHRLGVVHRDLKPSNLFLPSGEIAGVRVIDFGIARPIHDGSSITRTGIIVGTIGYLAPEQARGEREIGPTADVFSLGCVLFKCIAGEKPFVGEDLLASLLKVALEEAPRLQAVRDDVPEALSDLVATMLAKAPGERPRDAKALARELRALLDERAGGTSPGPPGRPTLTQGEQRVMSLVLVRRPGGAAPDEETQPIISEETLGRALRATVERHKGQLQVLADGSLLITVPAAGAATDLAVRAARCALAIRPLLGTTPIAVVSGRGISSPSLAVGKTIDRAVELLRRAAPEGLRGAIRIDEATAGLLDASFDLEREGSAFRLMGEREQPHAARTLLGRPIACVGRERELATLEALFAECAAEPVARAVLVTAGPGMGKSRLCHEFLGRLREREEDVEIWEARGDAMGERSPFGMLAQALQRAAGVSGKGPLVERWSKLRARVARVVPEGEVSRVAELLGELAGAPSPEDEASARILAARKDPLSIGDPLRRAWEAFLSAECAAHPVVLVLEDLHWGDLPTVNFVDAALRGLCDRPFFVLAAGRPEVHAAFPGLWERAEAVELRLPKLTRRAAERLARQALGEDASAETVAWILERADGNAFYLEELIRAAAERRRDDLPETVLSMVQARLSGMEPEARRVLRAASVFGLSFWEGGVASLLGEPRVSAWLELLQEREVISPPREGRFPGEVERAFRHTLVREAAYAMLTEADRALAHWLAGEWLATSGEGDAGVLAQHFERGGDPSRAAVFYQRAAEQALRGNDLEAAIVRAERGLEHAASGELRASLLMILLEAYAWRNEWARAAAHAEEVFRREAKGSRAWCMAAMGKVWSGSVLDRPGDLVEAMVALRDVESAPDAVAAMVQAQSAVVITMTIACVYDQATAYLTRMEQTAGPVEAREPNVRGWMELTRGFRVRQVEGDVFASLCRMRAAAESFVEGGSPQQTLWAKVHVALSLWLLGAHAEAERALEGPLREPSSGEKLRLVASMGRYVLANVLLDEGRLDEALLQVNMMIRAERAQGNHYLEGLGRSTLAQILRSSGALADAEGEATVAIELLSQAPYDRAIALGLLAAIRLDQGAAAEALGHAREAYRQILTTPGYKDAIVRVAYAEALTAAGDPAASAALAEAKAVLLARAAKIADAALRASFLERVPENARALALAGASA